MIGLGHGDIHTLVAHGAANVEANAVDYLLLWHARLGKLASSAHNGPQHSAGAATQGHGIAHMVSVVVGHKHNIHITCCVGGNARRGGKKGINYHLRAGCADFKSRVSKPGYVAHAASSVRQ